jgi:cytochrome c oxidase assembly protein subunit 11
VTTIASRNNRTAAYAALFGLAMLALAFASVPLYRLFCQVTGYGGTTQRVEQASATVGGAPINVRFDANVNGLPWKFEPVQAKVRVVPGEQVQVMYRATNYSAEATTGTATFNVSPGQTGKYFNKMQCFCFTEQTLKPGESIDMPVLFYVDPKLRTDEDTQRLDEITLSYTFYPVETPQSAS